MIKLPVILITLCCLISTTKSFSQTEKQITANNWAWQAIGIDKLSQPFGLKKQIKVAIIDDGFDIENPLWINNIAVNEKEIPGNNIDDDKNGKTDDYQGWDFGDNDENVRPDVKALDKEVHGTKVLGIFWQTLQQCNVSGISKISILPIKAVSDIKMNNYVMEGYKGIEYAIEQNADIILCSWSGPSIAEEEKKILEKAAAKKILIIASAGNFYALTPQYPGAVNTVINVAATDKANKKMKLSNYGMFVDISAPGDSLLTYYPFKKNADAYLSATSAATPIVAAVAAVMSSAYPSAQNDLDQIIKNTSEPLDAVNPLYAGNLGAGLINVAAIKNEIENKARVNKIFRQPKGYVDFQKLSKAQPIKIIPFGKYKNIKFLAANNDYKNSTDIRVTVFFNNKKKDSIISKNKLKYPFITEADSIYIYNAANKPNPSDVKQKWYYEVTTIDSSMLYCSGLTNVSVTTDGYIEDGSAGNNYTGRNECKWQLTAPVGKRFQLNFDEFETEAKIDQVYIFSGNSTKDPILAIFSGPNIPPSITSWSNEVLIWFLTSEENNFKGWKLHYKIID